ncbi:MAG TPA: META domain-containing protein [Usitatibacter sp.]|nr:META domain-containing protein [Usitatibacter sp.]
MNLARPLPSLLAALALAACAAPGGNAPMTSGGGTYVASASPPSPQPPSMTPGSAPSPSASASLAGTRWIATTDVDERSKPRVEFLAQGRLSGFTGCNMLSGAWRVEGGRVILGNLITTKRACAGPEGEVEKRFLAAVTANTEARRSGDRLELAAPGGGRFELRLAP